MERYLTLLGIHDFVQQVARYDSLKNRQDCQFSQAPWGACEVEALSLIEEFKNRTFYVRIVIDWVNVEVIDK